MTKYAAITSMNQKYYDHCGKSMLSSYKKFWSKNIPLYVYNEDNFNIKIKNVESVGWNLSNDYWDFQNRHTNTKVKTFAKKGFPIIDAMQNIECDRLIWLDADTILQRGIHLQLLNLIAPDDVLSTHFSVWHVKDNIEYHSCETGFFILNRRHKGFEDFYDTYRDIYVNDKTDGLRRFYDGEVYGKTVELMQDKGYKVLNLNPSKHKTPIPRSILSPYVTHYKAGLKDTLNNDILEERHNLD